MRALLFVAANQALLRHNLHGLQDGSVLRRLAGRDNAMDIANGGRPAAPEHGALNVALTDAADNFLNVARDALQLSFGEIELEPLP